MAAAVEVTLEVVEVTLEEVAVEVTLVEVGAELKKLVQSNSRRNSLIGSQRLPLLWHHRCLFSRAVLKLKVRHPPS